MSESSLLKWGGPVFNTTTVVMLIALVVSLLIWRKVGTQIKAFLDQTRAELQKCTWPWDPSQKGLKKYKELIDSSVVVIVASIFLATFITSADFILVKVIGFITRMH
ncbi:MAG: preprotein translocase subunit SecE [Methylacidiphilales bacterium]|nr:preprotein translocase subunit SecE [Candidatus Methylacidiphilales bacterium]MDW8350126.1 preprotein translocase subunit SecE [Verrucomicrobiae bacterium]